MDSKHTPVLVLIFNRPEKVRALIAALLKVKPTHIYVSADGPRAHIETDKTRCQEARDLFKNLPWDCEVLTKFSDVNLGCKKGPVEGITWFFQNVESGIILEDDCNFIFNFEEKIKSTMHLINFIDTDIIYLGANQYNYDNLQSEFINTNKGYYPISSKKWINTYGTYAISIRQEFCKLLYYNLINNIVDLPIDSYIQKIAIENNSNVKILYPFLIMPDVTDSDITGIRNQEDFCLARKYNLSDYHYLSINTIINIRHFLEHNNISLRQIFWNFFNIQKNWPQRYEV
jgi:GR25 family glycosyltransferase involved in LPS biosynthesis